MVAYPDELGLFTTEDGLLVDAAEAVKWEYRSSIKWKELRCRQVSSLTRHSQERIFLLEIGKTIEFDWTWEGAVAFRLPSIADQSDPSYPQLDEDKGDHATWSGEVVEVDETRGQIFVWLDQDSEEPTTGLFFVRPFEYLAYLHSIYCEPYYEELHDRLPARLCATRGGLHPPIESSPRGGLPELEAPWAHSWSVLWGPPGTGKTYTLGRQVASCLVDAPERILVVSTTNRATDEAARSIGRAFTELHSGVDAVGRLVRIGKSANYASFVAEDLAWLLQGTETDLLRTIDGLTRRLHRTDLPEERAILRGEIQHRRKDMQDCSFDFFISDDVRVVVATSFKAIALLNIADIQEMVADGRAPFTTIFIDEAGLLSRVTVAALSLLASRRVMLVGDSKQLAPISKVSRILPTSQAMWLGSSGLSHLQRLEDRGPAIHLLRVQHRMHPEICDVVSAYQYDRALETAEKTRQRQFQPPKILAGEHRTIWYVLDEDRDDTPAIRAERGPGNKSWIRTATCDVLRKFFSDDDMRSAHGLYISPFVAQAREVRSFLAKEELRSWSASTVHSQQGTEADIVIFDTVNAGSCGWPFDEWKRLINVGLSRAREFVLLIASRAEMQEPYLKVLSRILQPRILKWVGRSYKWIEVKRQAGDEAFVRQAEKAPQSIGGQLLKRKALRPVFSSDQERLCALRLDGKPRLVRGVAGSGKTVVLAHWLLKTMKQLGDQPRAMVWAVYANRALLRLISDTIEDAWSAENRDVQFPWDRVELWHIKDLLNRKLPHVGLRMFDFEFDYDAASAAYLAARGDAGSENLCHAMFIDEAQDMGPNTLKLLASIVSQSDKEDANSRSVNIFYDNAQNVYGRGTPKWSDLGLDLRGRSTVMKESFRSTKPITEYALNVLYRLQPPESDIDHKELIERGLIEKKQRLDKDWWNVRFNQVGGPIPMLKQFRNLDDEFESMSRQIVSWIIADGVTPEDICIIYNGKNIKQRIEKYIAPKLTAAKATLDIQTSKPFAKNPSAVKASTAHSFKGYDSEIVVVAAANQFAAKSTGILANTLYVAMTRARSILAIYGMHVGHAGGAKIMSVLTECLDLMGAQTKIEKNVDNIDELEDIVERIGQENRAWFMDVWKKHRVEQEPLLKADGEILAEPLFWYVRENVTYACFEPHEPSDRIRFALEDSGVEILRVGEALE